MNKLTITDKLFVPLIIEDKLIYKKKTNYLKEETNKYVLSKEEIEKVISDAFEAGANREYQERNYERRDYDAPIKEQYINSIL